MKKMLFVMMCAIGFACFAQDGIYKMKTAAEISEYYSAQIKKYPKAINYYGMVKLQAEALIGKDVKKMSYSELKDLFYGSSMKFEKYDKKTVDYQFESFVYWEANQFCGNVLKDSTITNREYSDYRYVIDNKVNVLYTKEQYREKIIAIMKLNVYTKSKAAFASYQSRILQFSDTEVRSDLKMMKRIVFPQITKSDEWKKIASDIELQLRSVE